MAKKAKGSVKLSCLSGFSMLIALVCLLLLIALFFGIGLFDLHIWQDFWKAVLG